jgi:hypothetical protein
VAREHGVARFAFGHALRAGLEDDEDVLAHAALVGTDALGE